MVDDSIDSGSNRAKTDNVNSEPSKVLALRRGLTTFIAHDGENKPFVRELRVAIEQQVEVAAFTDDKMAVGASAEHEIYSSAAEAGQGIVVISRPFLTKECPMKELNLFVEHGVKFFPLYYNVSPDDFCEIIATYDRRVLIVSLYSRVSVIALIYRQQHSVWLIERKFLRWNSLYSWFI